MSTPATEARHPALETIVTIAEAAQLSLDPHSLAQAVVEALIARSPHAAVALYGPSATPAHLELLHATGIPDTAADAARLLPVEGGLAGLALSRKDVVSSFDARGDERVRPQFRDFFAAEGMGSVTVVPLLYRDQAVGCIVLALPEVRAPTPMELETFRAIGRTVGLALTNAEQFARLKIALVELRAARERLQLILDTIPVRVFWKDRESRYLGCNAHFARDAGLASPGEVVGLTDRSLPWRETADVIQEIDREVLATGQAKLNYQLFLSRPDGSQRWENVSKIPLRDESGQIFGVLACYEDITERKRATDARGEAP